MNFNTRITVIPHTLGGFDYYTVEATAIVAHEQGGFPYYTIEPTDIDLRYEKEAA